MDEERVEYNILSAVQRRTLMISIVKSVSLCVQGT